MSVSTMEKPRGQTRATSWHPPWLQERSQPYSPQFPSGSGRQRAALRGTGGTPQPKRAPPAPRRAEGGGGALPGQVTPRSPSGHEQRLGATQKPLPQPKEQSAAGRGNVRARGPPPGAIPGARTHAGRTARCPEPASSRGNIRCRKPRSRCGAPRGAWERAAKEEVTPRRAPPTRGGDGDARGPREGGLGGTAGTGRPRDAVGRRGGGDASPGGMETWGAAAREGRGGGRGARGRGAARRHPQVRRGPG